MVPPATSTWTQTNTTTTNNTTLKVNSIVLRLFTFKMVAKARIAATKKSNNPMLSMVLPTSAIRQWPTN
eukprot:m.110153 g.110153  ORF g.110153 m.110153 type:complete len:69 (-) comp28017_c0_seq1:89-295(-)